MGTTYVPLMCYYDGELEHDTRNPIYVGGHMKADRVSKDISFPEFTLKMHELCKSPPEEMNINIKCRYLLDQHTSIAMHVEDENSLSIVMDLYPHHCNAIVAYIEKQSTQKSITIQRGHPSDLLLRCDNGETAGEIFNRQAFGSIDDTVTHYLQNCEGIHHNSVHRHKTASSSFSAGRLHDMASIPADRNANKNNSASGSFDDVESHVIDMYSSGSNVPSLLPRCGALKYRPGEKLDQNIRPELQGSGSLGECTMTAAIANEQPGQFVGQSSKNNSQYLEPVEDDVKSLVVSLQDWSSERSTSSRGKFSTRDDAGKNGKNLSSDSKRTQRCFLLGSECIESSRKLFNFHFISKWFGMRILISQSPWLQRWNRIFILSCVIAVTLDSFFLYTPVYDEENTCLSLDKNLMIITCVLRSVTDIFYILHIILQFRTALVSPSNGRLVDHPVAIAKQYLSSYFLVDILAVLPLPQVLIILIVIPILRGSVDLRMKLIKYVVLIQYLPRFIRIYPLYKEVTRTGKTAWAGAVINFSLYMLASHIFGALWYLFSIERKQSCWRDACVSAATCSSTSSFYCEDHFRKAYNLVHDFCSITGTNETTFDFGIYRDVLQSGLVNSKLFPPKLCYCFWWGLQNLGSLGQNIKASAYIWEICFSFSIFICGSFLYTLLIFNVQACLQSNTVRLEEMRVKRRDAEQWMSHRLLPENLRERIRRYEQYKWQKTRGVDEEDLLRNLPKDLRRDIKRHLCLSLLRRVPMFEAMDEQLFDAMCDRLKPALHTETSYIIREGDPVDEMLFIMRGKLLSVTTNGGRTGFFNSEYLKAGDFCGEELLTWALDPHSSSNLPISTRTVQALAEVEAFALMADDLKFVASQFQRLHGKQLRHTFRFYSQQWRTWAARYIQAAWRSYKKKLEKDRLQDALAKGDGISPSLGATIYASRFVVNALGAIRRNRTRKARLQKRLPPMLLQKPLEPDFSTEYY